MTHDDRGPKLRHAPRHRNLRAAQRRIWTGSDDGLVYLTRDGGTHWRNATPPDFRPIAPSNRRAFDARRRYGLRLGRSPRDGRRCGVYFRHARLRRELAEDYRRHSRGRVRARSSPRHRESQHRLRRYESRDSHLVRRRIKLAEFSKQLAGRRGARHSHPAAVRRSRHCHARPRDLGDGRHSRRAAVGMLEPDDTAGHRSASRDRPDQLSRRRRKLHRLRSATARREFIERRRRGATLYYWLPAQAKKRPTIEIYDLQVVSGAASRASTTYLPARKASRIG